MKFKDHRDPDQAVSDAWAAKGEGLFQGAEHHGWSSMPWPEERNHPVEYFASADPKLFVNIINKFMGGMSHGGHDTQKAGAADHEGMNHEAMNHDAMNHEA